MTNGEEPRPTAAARPSGRRPGRARRIAVILSVALNLFLVALIAGHVIGRAHHHDQGPGRAGKAVRAFIQEHAPDLKSRAREIMGARRAAVDARRQALRAARRAARAALVAEPYDPEAFAAAQARRRAARAALRAEIDAALAELAAELTPAQREQFARALARRGGRRGHRP